MCCALTVGLVGVANTTANAAPGKYNVTRSKTHGLANITAIGKSIDTKPGQGTVFNRTTAQITHWESSLFGRYPSARPAASSPASASGTPWRHRAEEEDWSGKVADPGRDHIYDDLVYYRGAMAVHALRIRFVERLTNRDLDAFFHTWLYQPGKPTL